MTAGTIFQDTRKPLTLWFRAMWYVTSQKNGASALGVQRVLGLGSYQTAWTWLHKLRRAMVRPGRDRLSGRVEVEATRGKDFNGNESSDVSLATVEIKDHNGQLKVWNFPPLGRGKVDICGVYESDEERQHVAALNYDYARQFVKRGYVVIAPDWRGLAHGELCRLLSVFPTLRLQEPEKQACGHTV